MYPLNEGAFEQTLFKFRNSSQKQQACYPLTYLQEVNEGDCVLNELNTKRWSPQICGNLGQIKYKIFCCCTRKTRKENSYIWNTRINTGDLKLYLYSVVVLGVVVHTRTQKRKLLLIII